MTFRPKSVKVTFTYHPDGLPLKEPLLIGSWTPEGLFCPAWKNSEVPLRLQADGSWSTEHLLRPAAEQQVFWWGVQDQGRWMLFGSEAKSFQPLKAGQAKQSFRLGYRNFFGLNPRGDDGFRACVWAPHARAAALYVEGPSGARTYPLKRAGEIWLLEVDAGWSTMLGCPYGFLLTTSEGNQVLRADPYARRRQGPQRGVSDLFLKGDGHQTHMYAQDLDKGIHLLRFEAVPRPSQKRGLGPVLRLFQGERQLSASELKQRLRHRFSLPKGEAWWWDQLALDGSIGLKRRTGVDAYSVCLGPARALRGLRYQIVDLQGTTYHDPWDNTLKGNHNWSRLGLCAPAVRREERRRTFSPVTAGHRDLVLYELHVGSFLGQGGNLRPSNFDDVLGKLKELKDLGFTGIALMPTNATEGWRDWGYLGTCTFAHHEAYASPGEFAEETLLRFITEAHKLGLRVFNDVVYNHVGGDHNDLWEFDGIGNSWFERQTEFQPKLAAGTALARTPENTSTAKPRTLAPEVRNTPWGPIPAYNKPMVAQFFIDHAIDQLDRFGFDGLRFDFTHLIHSEPGGGEAGWHLLRELNTRIEHFFPEALTFAEEFPPHPIITAPVDAGGAGFDAMWNTEHQHRLIYSHHRRSLTEATALGESPPISYFLEHLLNPDGFTGPLHQVTVLSNHDEVGNATRLARLVAPHSRPWDLARLVCWLSLLSPGYPILFQGTEELAENFFSWGLPSTWDTHGPRIGQPLKDHQAKHRRAIKDVLEFRHRYRDLHSEVPISNHFHQPDEALFGFRRGGLWVIANFGAQAAELPTDLPVSGPALLNSERKVYGYQASPSRGRRIGSLSLKVFARK